MLNWESVKSILTPNRTFIAAAAVLAAAAFVGRPPQQRVQAANGPESAPQELSPGLLRRSGCAERGRQVFFDRQRAKCSGCHSVDDDQGLAGPNLWAVGSKLSKRGLLDAIVEPSAEIAPQYHVYILDTETHGLVIGVIAKETEDQLIVLDESGEETRLQPSAVLDRRKSDLSMMPADIVETLNERELVDLLEYLTTLRPAGSVPPI